MAAVKEILAKTEGSSLDLGQTVVFLIKNIFVDNILADCRAPGAGTIVQRDWQAEGGTRLVEKKVRDQPVIMIRQAWIDKGDAVPMVRQCDLAGVSRTKVYAQQKPKLVDESYLLLSHLTDEEYTRHPFFGSRKMVVFLNAAGHIVNRKRVQGLMRKMGLAGMAPGPNTSRPPPAQGLSLPVARCFRGQA